MKEKEQNLVRTLRKRGLSYTEIKEQVNVSKSSISRWCKKIELKPEQNSRLENKKQKGAFRGRKKILKSKIAKQKDLDEKVSLIYKLYWEEKQSVPQISKLLNIGQDYIYAVMKRNNISRRDNSESNFLVHKDKPKFKIKKNLNIEEEKLRIAGIMLYWAEGAKNGQMIDFVNSNPNMIKLFLTFLRSICGISEKRLAVYLYGYSFQNINKLKKYWSKITQIPLDQFTKPYIRKGNSNKSGRKLPYGLVHIRYSDKKLFELIKNWIEEYSLELK